MNITLPRALDRRAQTTGFKIPFVLQSTLTILVGLVTPSFLLGQTQPVRMSFSDQASLNNPSDDSRAVLATGFSRIQESDFEPKSTEAQLEEQDNQGDPPPRPEIDDVSEAPKSEDEKEADEPFEKLESDEPFEAPSFSLTEETSDDPSSSNEDQRESTKGKETALDDGYRLPTVAGVRVPISPVPFANVKQHDPGGLLVADLYNSPHNVGPHTFYSEVQGVPATAKFKTWRAHNVYHRPTYFEDKNLELNGNRRPFQNVASAVSFLGTIPRIPYLVGEHHPREKIYTFGDDRPGDPTPFRVFQPTGNRRGRVLQTISTLGLVLP